LNINANDLHDTFSDIVISAFAENKAAVFIRHYYSYKEELLLLCLKGGR
jgi:hypothetical protein